MLYKLVIIFYIFMQTVCYTLYIIMQTEAACFESLELKHHCLYHVHVAIEQ